MPIITCPHCKEQEGFYLKEQVRGSSEPHFTKEGHYANKNGHIYESLNHSGGKRAYCMNCNGYIGKSVELISGLSEEEVYGRDEF
ncbi:hypothetical protein BTS2_3322 [Bacillus sp. TS-2]|nr:hypothetical protein BTS2_3322 [Bacillus sp. TS-2]